MEAEAGGFILVHVYGFCMLAHVGVCGTTPIVVSSAAQVCFQVRLYLCLYAFHFLLIHCFTPSHISLPIDWPQGRFVGLQTL